MLAPRDALASDCGAVAAWGVVPWVAPRVARAGRADGPLAESDDERADELAAELEAGLAESGVRERSHAVVVARVHVRARRQERLH